VHVVSDTPDLGIGQGVLDGFEPSRRIVCQRGENAQKTPTEVAREFWAEEAGRAAAISYAHLQRSEWCERLMRLAGKEASPAAWTCLYRMADILHVNVTALVTQLELEGWIVSERKGAGSKLHVQPSLIALGQAGR
jgi:hypothetical protein